MTLQQKTINRYRQFFPNDTLRETSKRTGIQMTRVFRLFNGMNMKVKELEVFEQVINQKIAENPNYSLLIEAMEEASAVLTNEELAKITDYITRKKTNKSYSRNYFSTYHNAIIA